MILAWHFYVYYGGGVGLRGIRYIVDREWEWGV